MEWDGSRIRIMASGCYVLKRPEVTEPLKFNIGGQRIVSIRVTILVCTAEVEGGVWEGR